MGMVNFYLKEPKAESEISSIFLQFKYNGQRLKFNFGQSVNISAWSFKKQRVKSNAQTTADGKHSLNDLLDSLVKVCNQAYNAELKNGIPTPDMLKKYLIDFINQNHNDQEKPTFFSLAQRFICNEIKHEGSSKAKGTIKTYKVVVSYLKEFERSKRYKIDFDTITLDFYYKYITYLETVKQRIKDKKGEAYKIGLAPNTIAKQIQVIKAIMNEAVDLCYTTNMQFKHKKFKVKWIDTDAVYLNDKEIMRLYKADFSKSQRLEKVRDLFVFGCCVGLRFSDYSDIRPENIVDLDGELFLRVQTKKTRELVIIPCNPIVLQIFKKYEHSPNRLPVAPSNQKFNVYIKEVCEKAGLTETGRLIDDPTLPLFECVSSHTARRSFATNLYLEGYPTLEIMKITGHKSEKSFLKYIKVSKIESARKLHNHIKLKWSEKILRIAG